MISLIFSFKNEEKNIPILINRVINVFQSLKYDYELIFVNDCSTDNSLKLLTEIHAHDPKIKIINTSRCFGNSPCVLAGMSYSNGDAVIYMDCDLQDPPELIPEMLKHWEDGNEVVHTKRTVRHGENAVKMWITKRAYNVINFFSDIELPENVGDFKLISRRALTELLKIEEKEPYLRGLVTWIGFKQTIILYERQSRATGESHYPIFGKGPFYAFIAGLTSFSNAPLYFSLFTGFFISFCTILYLFYVVITRIFYHMHQPGWSALMTVMLFTSGITLFTNGIIGIYVGKIAVSVKPRPLYLIDSVIGFDSGKR